MARPRKPTALKKQAGTLQPCRTNPAEPQLPPELPPPPPGLDDRVLDAYMDHGKRVLDLRALTRADAGALAAMAQVWVQIQTDTEALEAFKLTNNGSHYYESEGASGRQIKAHPAVSARQSAMAQYRSWCGQFGLTPSSRSQVSAIDTGGEKSKLAKLMEMRKTG